MKTILGWILAIALGVTLLLVAPGLIMVGGFWLGGHWGMMGGHSMMNWAYGSMHPYGLPYGLPFGWIGMLFALLILAGGPVLVVVGAVALVNSLTKR